MAKSREEIFSNLQVVKRNGKRVVDKLDHIHTPDPLSQEICILNMKIEKLNENKIRITLNLKDL